MNAYNITEGGGQGVEETMFDHHLGGRRQGKGPKRFLVKTCTHLISISQTINSFVIILELQTSFKGNEILSYVSVQNGMGFDSDLIFSTHGLISM